MIKSTPIKFKNLPTEFKARLKKLNGSSRKFVKNVYKDELLLFWKAAKGVGVILYAELKFLKGIDGDQFHLVSNNVLDEKYAISRQSKYIAIKKLKAEGLIDYKVTAGKNIECRLLTK